MSSYPGGNKSGSVGEIDLFLLQVPLTKTYVLSFDRLDSFHTLVCRINIDGSDCWGETTPLPGYGTETVEEAWRWSVRAADFLSGKTVDECRDWLKAADWDRPFCIAAIATALEYPMVAGWLGEKHRIIAVKGIDNGDVCETVETAMRHYEEGYRTFKMKYVGELDSYLHWISEVLDAVPEAVSIRIDANQALDLDAAIQLWDVIDKPCVEYLEQPFSRHDWKKLALFFERRSEARICLDESIWVFDDIARAEEFETPITFKLKLMKAASPSRLASFAEVIRNNGKRIVFGNGVQSDVGTLAEFAMYRQLGLDTAAELNGFARQRMSVVDNFPVRMDRGCIALDPWSGNISLKNIFVKRSYHAKPRGGARWPHRNTQTNETST